MHCGRITTREIGSSCRADEECVAGEETIVGEDGHRVGRVPRSVDDFEAEVADEQLLAVVDPKVHMSHVGRAVHHRRKPQAP